MKKIILSTFVVSSFLFAAFVASSFLFAVDYTNSIGMVFKEIPAGSFMMGTPNCSKYKDDKCEDGIDRRRSRESPIHRVNVDSFYMGETEVTQGQWHEVMGDNPAEFKTGNPNMPVETVSWDDVQKFISRLNQKEGGNKYRLPTEEEWEYAARAGTTTKWYCGDDESCVSSIAWYGDNSGRITHPVKSKKPNAFGLYDMSGNIWELTHSCWRVDYNSREDCKYRSSRGGSWDNYAGGTRSANRSYSAPDDRCSDIGFRLLRMK